VFNKEITIIYISLDARVNAGWQGSLYFCLQFLELQYRSHHVIQAENVNHNSCHHMISNCVWHLKLLSLKIGPFLDVEINMSPDHMPLL